ncbi:MAG: hypothetical protein JOZ58_25160 [Acetobacteraceae bacterium]|nr:hypothetical protein [Acetobacteraceae bacterium]
MTDQLPATIVSGTLAPTSVTDTYIVPALIADVGEPAAWRYVEFFTANIRNQNIRRAYARACSTFFAWCQERGLTLMTIRPFDVAAWIEQLQAQHEAAGEAAARGRAHAVRLADHRPGAADEPGCRDARANACGKDRQHAGA